MAAGVGACIYKDMISASKELVVWDKIYEPNELNKKIYDEQKQKFELAYKAQLALVYEGVTTSMWKAPGI